MKAVGVREVKKELQSRSQDELIEVCLQLAKFKKENKELLTYLLYDSNHEPSYIESIKDEIDLSFQEMNVSSYFYMKKSIRKILRNTKKYIRYSKKKETEVELLLYFCEKMAEMTPSIRNSTVLLNLFDRTKATVRKSIEKLHEDLQFDFVRELDEL